MKGEENAFTHRHKRREAEEADKVKVAPVVTVLDQPEDSLSDVDCAVRVN